MSDDEPADQQTIGVTTTRVNVTGGLDNSENEGDG